MWFKKDINPKHSKKSSAGIDFIEIAGDEGAPTIMLLHGFGADYEDLCSLASSYTGTLRPRWIFPNGPEKAQIGLFSLGRSWFNVNIPLLQKAFKEKDYEAVQNAFPEEISAIRQRLDAFLIELNIAPRNLIIGGFSQGAVLATEVALHAFERPMGLLIFSGTLLHKESWKHLAAQKGSLPFFQSHGENDPLLPIELAAQLEALLLEAGLTGKLHRFAGGHEINQTTLSHLNHFLQKLIIG